MAIFENFPYTNMHEMNLDYILETQKKQKEAFEDVIEEATEIKDQTDELKNQTSILKNETSELKDDTAALNVETALLKNETQDLKDETQLLKDQTESYKQEVQGSLNQIQQNTTDIQIQTARIDGLATLEEGSTTGDAELIDIRTGGNNMTYSSAGNAVRGQYKQNHDTLAQDTDYFLGLTSIYDFSGEDNRTISTVWSGVQRALQLNIPVQPGRRISLIGDINPTTKTKSSYDFSWRIRQYDSSDNLLGTTEQALSYGTITALTNSAVSYINIYMVVTLHAGISVPFDESFKAYFKLFYSDGQLNRYIKTPQAWTTGADLATTTDLNTVTTPGVYKGGYASTYPNSPIENANFVLEVINNDVSGTIGYVQIYKSIFPYVSEFIRRYADGHWNNWKQNAINNINSLVDNNANTSTAENKGQTIKVLSYNVANYNNDSATYIRDERLNNFKKMLSKTKADFVGIQEDREYVDAGNTKNSEQYIYKPVFPFKKGIGGPTIHTKLSSDLISNDIVEYTSGRVLRYGVYTLANNKKLLFGSTHMVAGTAAENIAARETQYNELIQWLEGIITLKEYGSATDITVPAHDYAVICMDSNAETSTDRTNLKTAVETYGYSMANGGWLGWLVTHRNNNPLDNIVCSPNIIIDSIEVLNSEFDLLYSDHIPVLAEMTLLS